MNVLPMAAHGGLMPVAFEVVRDSGYFPEVTVDSVGQTYGRSKDIVLYREDVRFEWLADRFVVNIPGYHPNIFSLGDVFLGVGLAVASAECLLGAVFPRIGIGLVDRRRSASQNRSSLPAG